jgi:hypothetical protein
MPLAYSHSSHELQQHHVVEPKKSNLLLEAIEIHTQHTNDISICHSKSSFDTAKDTRMIPTTNTRGRTISTAHDTGILDFCSSCRRWSVDRFTLSERGSSSE